MPKSSQAARNSCLSVARRSASRRRQAGSTLKKLNLAKVRSAGIALTIALLVGLAAVPGASAASSTSRRLFQRIEAPWPTVDLVFVPSSTTVTQFAKAGFSPGLMSAGLGTVTPEQTYLDIGAGNRVFNSLYDHELGPAPKGAGACRAWFAEAVPRAESAPDEIEPGLMVKRLEEGAGHGGVAVTGAEPWACPLGAGVA